ncbi:MAG: hypothetical protein KDE48_15325, partial [Anaerolineales bacterium]|nr:hypothetical protein [Anaerolineales bacterium]
YFCQAVLVDTFELAEGRQMPLFAPENTQRVQRQKNTPIFVIIGNPPYNAHQVNENDNSKNRTYRVLDERVSETYAKDSRQTNKVALSDVYVKAFRWASDRIGDEGIVAFVTNNGFVDGLAFDGMRQHLAQDFDAVYILDLGGNVRKNPKLSGTTHNVFGIQVGVSINFLVKKQAPPVMLNEVKHPTSPEMTNTSGILRSAQNDISFRQIYYARTDEFWRKEEKYDFLEQMQDWQGVTWQTVKPNKKHHWLTEGLQSDFEDFLPIGTKATKAGDGNAIFGDYGCGVATSRDAWVYNFDRGNLSKNVSSTIESYNDQVSKWTRTQPNSHQVNDFISNDSTKISWSRDLKLDLKRGNYAEFNDSKIRNSMRRPFTKQYLFFDRILNEEVYRMPSYFPLPTTGLENQVICVSDNAHREPFSILSVNVIPDFHILATKDRFQCFPFYTYAADGSQRRENITDWALTQFRAMYQTSEVLKTSEVLNMPLTKWHIFHYIYALLHHPTYRETYAANLRRELPRIPFVQPQHFWPFVHAGERLAHIHAHYEEQPEYPLTHTENPDEPLNYRVEKMRLSK